jgi:tRNA(Ile)-lysidine synthase
LLRCLHVEHGIRAAHESRTDADFVVSLCEKLSVPCTVVSIPQGKVARFAKKMQIGIEAAARYFRRRAFFREKYWLESGAVPLTGCGAQNAAQVSGQNSAAVNVLILTAHTCDDSLELALMRVLRGSGPEGLAAMRQRRGCFVRPLLAISRSQVLDYLNAKKILWREDSSNLDTKFLRNRIRHKLIPLLNDVYPSWKNGVSAMAETQFLAAQFLRERRLVWNGGFDEESFFAEPLIIREESLFRAINSTIKNRSARTIKRSVLRRFCRGELKIANFGHAVAARENGRIVVKHKKKECFERGFSLLIKKPGLYTLKGIVVRALAAKQLAEQQSADKQQSACEQPKPSQTRVFYASLPLLIRPRRREDTLVSGGRKIAHNDAKEHRLCAVDNFGTAAFIGADGLPLITREPENNTGAGKTFFCITGGSGYGGVNAKQTE